MFAAWTVCIIQLQDQRDDQPCLICSHVMSVGREFRHEMGPTRARGDDKGQSSGGCSLCLLHGLSDMMLHGLSDMMQRRDRMCARK